MLKEVKDLSESVPTTGDARFLKHYTEEERQSMLMVKQDFVSFLLGLQNMRQVDYALLAVHEKNGEHYIHLLIEWLYSNQIFSEKELDYCPKLRQASFVDAVNKFLPIPMCDRIIVPYMVAYIVVK